jgi:hypothetical protein
MITCARLTLRMVLVVFVITLGVLAIVFVLHGCGTAPPGTMAGHNTTLPAQPACLLFCFAEVRSSIDTQPVEQKDKKGKGAQPPVVVPPPVINTAPTTPAKPALQVPQSRSYP